MVAHRAAAGDVIPEAQLRDLLRLVDLEYLVERPGGLRAVVDWGAQLSLGACCEWTCSMHHNELMHALVRLLGCQRLPYSATVKRQSGITGLCVDMFNQLVNSSQAAKWGSCSSLRLAPAQASSSA